MFLGRLQRNHRPESPGQQGPIPASGGRTVPWRPPKGETQGVAAEEKHEGGVLLSDLLYDYFNVEPLREATVQAPPARLRACQ